MIRVRRDSGAAVLAALALLATPTPIYSDALVITRAMLASTIAEVFIGSDSAVVEVSVGVRDMYSFRDLLPDRLYEALGNEPEPWEERLPRFLDEGLVVTDLLMLCFGQPTIVNCAA